MEIPAIARNSGVASCGGPACPPPPPPQPKASTIIPTTDRRLRLIRQLPSTCVALALRRHQQQESADDNRPDAGPDRNVDGLLVLHRQLERADLGLVGLLRVTKAAVHQPQDAGRDQYDSDDLDGAHLRMTAMVSSIVLVLPPLFVVDDNAPAYASAPPRSPFSHERTRRRRPTDRPLRRPG